jgi:hypothetical protein
MLAGRACDADYESRSGQTIIPLYRICLRNRVGGLIFLDQEAWRLYPSIAELVLSDEVDGVFDMLKATRKAEYAFGGWQ